jgi:NifU-like protein involved in Fe-S cluster formation
MAYSEVVMDHFKNPRNVGEMKDADGVGEVGNPICGDMMSIYIKVKDDRIDDIKFLTFGCGAAIAVSSMVTEMARGKSLEEAKKITNKSVAQALAGLPTNKLHCSGRPPCRHPELPGPEGGEGGQRAEKERPTPAHPWRQVLLPILRCGSGRGGACMRELWP